MICEPQDRLCDSTFSHRVEPRTMRVVIVTAIIMAHAFFLYGQTAIMWYLFSEIHADVLLTAESFEAKLAFRALRLHNPSNISVKFHQTIEAFTYMDAIRGLWTGHTGPVDPRFVNPGPGPWGKVSAILLILFSAIWPHAKLIGLNYQYHRAVKPGNEEARTTTLYWLDTFGKWSLADVFVICVLLAVLNLDIPLQADRVLEALKVQLEDLTKSFTRKDNVQDVSRAVCSAFFYPDDECDFSAYNPGHCTGLKDSCVRCACMLETVFPTVNLLLRAVSQLLVGVKASGSLIGVLRVAGRSGIYVFCLATLTSLSLSWVIDGIDHRTRSKRKIRSRTLEEGAFFNAVNVARAHEDTERLSLVDRGNVLAGMINEPHQTNDPDDPLAVDADTAQALMVPLQTPHVRQSAVAMRGMHPSRWVLPVSVLGIVLVLCGSFVPTLQRRVPGSIMDIVADDLDVNFIRDYSIFNLVQLTGVAGGPDNLLMTSFGLFIIVGPIIRAVITCVLAFIPLPSRPQRKLAFFTSTLGVFSGWDVLLVAFVLVRLEMPRITQGIVSPSLPICKFFEKLGRAPYCISIEFLFLWPEFLLIPIGAICLLFAANRIIRIAFFTFDPFGDGYAGAPKYVAALVG